MSTISNLVAEAVAAILIADRPEAIPSTVGIHFSGTTQDLARPFIAALTEGFEDLHPKLVRGTFTIETGARLDESTAATSGAWHAAAVAYFVENPGSLYATLHPLGWRLTAITKAGNGDTSDGDRGRTHRQTFTVCLQKI